MTRLEFMTRDLTEQTLTKQPVTKQDLIEYGVIQEETPAICMRDARASDRVAIRELTLAAYEEYAESLGEYWEGYRDGIVQALEDLRKDDLGKPAQQIVVDDNGEIVAALLLYPAGTTFTAPNGPSVTAPFPELRLLAVSPHKRGRGLGTLLTREGVARAKEQKAKTVMLHTMSVMPHLAQMYKAMGFVRFPRFDFEFAPGVGLESYRLDLQENKRKQ